ncbi:NADH dehydrogenase [ubiquinone] 1 alpha subcomplex subunit 8-B-like [Iris pallida]|uniref:NADH dehydrogenase [ubiquinone] 1 alpha subcomplex subunit 8-B-like n=1 Tax=Iris pallida TaxID=29817 RepID=A0AAX6I2H5_IRIPA|nr:NADH dehydrogenase [ubiquinone] 1 alpha subcomplex subunit 8-B-like [Iris pallida]
MATSTAVVDALGNPIPTSAVLTASSKHIATSCRSESVAFVTCKRKDQNPEKCLEKGREVTHCVLNLLKGLHQSCSQEMDTYARCMHYNNNEFYLCRREQAAFERACPWSSE